MLLTKYRYPVIAVAWLATFLLVPPALSLLAPSMEVTLVRRPGQVYAEVAGARLDLPSEHQGSTVMPAVSQDGYLLESVDGAETSLYWQPGQGGVFGWLGAVGEWLQGLRPAARWEHLGTEYAPNIQRYTYRYRLVGGRVPASLTIPEGSGPGGGYAFVVRAERRNFSWWRVEGGERVAQVAAGIYRPPGGASAADTASEALLVATAASALGFMGWAVGVVSRWRKGEASAGESTPGGMGRTWVGAALSHRYAMPLALFVAGTVAGAAACVGVLDGIPHVQDDVAYIFQGRIFALGRSWVPTPPAPEFFANGFIEMYEGRWFAKYPPGYPLLLVPGLWAGLPWLINPLSMGVSLALVYASGRRMFGRHVALWAGLLGLLSPWVIFMSGSFMSHPATMMWAALFMYAIVRMRDGGGGRRGRSVIGWPLLAGAAIGMAFITRQWTALGIGLGVALWAVDDVIFAPRAERRRRLLRYLLVPAGFVPPLLFILYENRQLTGDWLRFAQDLVGTYDRPGFGPGHGDAEGHTPALGVYNALVYLRTLGTMFNGWPAPLALAPLVLGLFAWVGEGSSRRARWDALLWMGALGLVGAYFLWWSSTTIFGARYWYEAMPFLLLAAGRGLDLLGRLAGGALARGGAGRARWLVPGALVAVLTLYNVTQSIPYAVSQYRDYNGISATALRNAEGAKLTNALVFVQLDPAKPNRDYGKVFFANDPLLRGERVYARDLGPEKNREVLAFFPGRAAYWLPLDGQPVAGVGPSE